jgi:hypothetical protein
MELQFSVFLQIFRRAIRETFGLGSRVPFLMTWELTYKQSSHKILCFFKPDSLCELQQHFAWLSLEAYLDSGGLMEALLEHY